MSTHGRPGSAGEHELQNKLGTTKRANAFYDNQVLDHLTPLMREFIERMTMAFIATSDAHGECDSSFRAGPAGFMRVIDEKTVMWPEYKGNGVTASDRQPTASERQVAAKLHDELKAVKVRVDDLLKKDVPAFNDRLRSQGGRTVISAGP